MGLLLLSILFDYLSVPPFRRFLADRGDKGPLPDLLVYDRALPTAITATGKMITKGNLFLK